MPHLTYCARRGALFTVALATVLAGCGKTTPKAAPTPGPATTPTTTVQTSKKPDGPKFTRPEHVHGIYLTAWSAASPRKMTAIFDMLKKTDLNSVVIDVRDTGTMYWPTGIPLAAEVNANEIASKHLDKIMAKLSENGVYPIARIACFRDAFVPRKYRQRGVITPDGGMWTDRSGHPWLDPYNKDNWEYIGKVVDFALDAGFPEIQLDYVRFPSEGKSKTQRFPGKSKYPDQNAKPEDVISAFANFIHDKVKARGATLSADIFGIVSISKSDQGIGQELEKVAAPFDLISPMVYPSHFAAGEYGIKYPAASPYEIITKSLSDTKRRLGDKGIRPWLQDFSIKAKGQPTVHYGVSEIRAQIKAVHDLGYDDYLMWNAGNHYTEAAYPKH